MCHLYELCKDGPHLYEPVGHEHEEDFQPYYRIDCGTQEGINLILEFLEVGMVFE